MKFQAHKGVSTEAPENTMESIRVAVEQGYHVAEIDVSVTKDGQFVLLHDKTLNRTARMPDGSELDGEVCISDVTYEQALTYDFGIAFSRKFEGTRIAFFWDVLEFAKRVGIRLKINNKYEYFSDTEKEALFLLLSDYQNVAELTCKTIAELKRAAIALPFARFHYDGNVSEETLTELSEILPRERLTVWLPILNKRTAWAKTEVANPERCETVKKYAKLGIWTLSDCAELAMAKSLGADIIETDGQLKPPMNAGIVPDMHTHSSHSHDCSVPLVNMRAAQEANGCTIAAVTDHCDIGFYKKSDVFESIKNSVSEVIRLNARNDSNCRLLTGVEIGDGILYPEQMRKAEIMCDYDVIIGSIHCVMKDDELLAYSRMDFSKEGDEYVYEFLDRYFDSMQKLVETADFDVLAHLTCPLRYIVGKHKKKADLTRYDSVITDILKKIIKKGIALEINTSSLSLALGDFVPHTDIIKKYRQLGGYLITLGSDAHLIQEASANFESAKEHLKKLGFENIYYYKKRIAHQCRLV